jgi:hypothetical protein
MLEKLLIMHCAPTLAGIKTANLFQCGFVSKPDYLKELQGLNRKLNEKGILLEVLRMSRCSSLILAYRPKCLSYDLGELGVDTFLQKFGYENIGVEYAIARLKERFALQSGFPHEIGLFLGYPLVDVVGFIQNNGRNSRHSGCWKVYRDEKEAIKLFERYKKCREVYVRLFSGGRTVQQLTVAA